MSMDRDVNVNLNINPDPQLAQKLNQTTGQIRAEFDKLGQSTGPADLSNDMKLLAANTEKASGAARGLAQSVTKVQQSAPLPFDMVGGGASPNPAQPKQPVGGGGVGVGGAARALGSAGGLIGSASGSAGIGQAGQAMGMLASNISTLGPAGVLATGAAIGLSLAMKEVNKASEEARREMELVLDARFAEIDAAGKTTEEIKKQIEEQTRIATDAREKQSAALQEMVMDKADRDGLQDIGDALGIWSDGVQEANEAAEEQQKKAEDANAAIEGLNEALGSTETAAADAKKAMEDLAEQMAEDLMDSADDAGEAVRELTSAQERSRESNADRLKQIASEQKALQASLKVLQSQEDSTGKAAKQIEVLNAKLSDLGREAGTVSQVMGQQASAQSAVAKSTWEVGRSMTFSLDMRSKEQKEKLKEYHDAIRKSTTEAYNKMVDIDFDAAKQREKIAIDSNREQERLIRESKQQFDQDFYQDFLGEFRSRQQLAFNLNETQIGAGQSFADVGRESFNAQQQARAQTPGAQQLMNNTFNISGDTQSIMRTLHQAGVVS